MRPLVAAFKRGESPESIHESYNTVALVDVYAVLVYYLRHRVEVEAHLAEQEREGSEIQAFIESGSTHGQAIATRLAVRILDRMDDPRTTSHSPAIRIGGEWT